MGYWNIGMSKIPPSGVGVLGRRNSQGSIIPLFHSPGFLIPKPLIQTQRLCVFDHYSNIPAFHYSMWMLYKRTTLKDILFQ
jgi:hypothetical protein